MARPPRTPARASSSRKGSPSGPKTSRSAAAVSVVVWLRTLIFWPTAGAFLGVIVVAGALYRGALATVDHRLGGEVWTLPAHVWSGPIEAWPGLRLEPGELADELVAAGYARVPHAQRPGDFEVTADAVLIEPREGKGEILVTFAAGKVASITPGGRLRAEPMILATLRGPDNENRNPVHLDEVPEVVPQAILAMEDARFYEHAGVDPVGIIRALWVDLLHQEWQQGGSTLTQQLAKNLFLSHDRTAGRKLREVLLSFALERRLDKSAILELYLSEIYLGQAGSSAVCGVDAAARAYFGKPASRLELGEAATLAGIIASPNAWSPIRHPEEARTRRDLALERMVEAGFLDRAAADAARAAPLVVNPAVAARQAPFATDTAVDTVEAILGEGEVVRQALDVHTTLVPSLQSLAEITLAEGAAELVAAHPKLSGVQAALVVVRADDGAVVAMVGGRDYATSNYNRATSAIRPIGSTIKPLTALVAFEADPTLSPATRLDDAPIERTHDGKRWAPTNYDGSFLGPISIRRAIALSRNVPAVLLAERAGMDTLRRHWRALGLSRATNYPSAALGGFEASPLELAGAYAVLAGDGRIRAPRLVVDARDAQGKSAWSAGTVAADPGYSARARWLTNDILRTVMAEGTGKNAARYGVGGGARGKSGTTDGYKDAWFVGTVGNYAVVVWVGFDQNQPVGLTGSKAALPIWARFVAGTGLSTQLPRPPAGVEQVEVCEETDLPPCPSCESTRLEWFTAGQAPAADCGVAGLFVHTEGGPGFFRRLGALLGLNADPEAPAVDTDNRGPDGVPVPR